MVNLCMSSYTVTQLRNALFLFLETVTTSFKGRLNGYNRIIRPILGRTALYTSVANYKAVGLFLKRVFPLKRVDYLVYVICPNFPLFSCGAILKPVYFL